MRFYKRSTILWHLSVVPVPSPIYLIFASPRNDHLEDKSDYITGTVYVPLPMYAVVTHLLSHQSKQPSSLAAPPREFLTLYPPDFHLY